MADEIIRLDNEDFFKLAHQGYEKSFIKDGVEFIKDVSTDIVETVSEIPYVGTVIKFGKFFGNIRNLMFVKRVASFFEANRELTDEERDRFYNEVLGYGKEERSKLADYLISLIAAADNDEKATIMGWIFSDRVKNHIDTDMMLRLCSIVNRCFLNDLKTLGEYQTIKVTSDFVSTNLFSLGLLENCGIDGGTLEGDDSGIRYTQSEVGKQLYRILHEKGWIV